MKKFLLFVFVFAFLNNIVIANDISKHIKDSNFSRNTKVSLYVVDKKNNSVVYKHNEKDLLRPASVLKLLTFGRAYSVLGKDYNFETTLYKDSSNNLYIKLGGDVLLTQKDLNKLLSNVKQKDFENIYIDDTIFEPTHYPQTWLDEDKWPHQRAITPYIVNNNMVKLSFTRSSLATKVDILQEDDYNMPIINELKLGDRQDIKIVRLYGDDSLIINFQGTVNKDSDMVLPVFSPEINFNIRLRKALENNKLVHTTIQGTKKVPQNAVKISSVSHNIKDISKLILHNSDNFASEVVFRVAGAKYIDYNNIATIDDSIKMFNDRYSEYMSSKEVIYDASGVSRQNRLCAKTIANILSELFKSTDLEELLSTSNQGTLSDRVLFLNDNIKAKTGTMRMQSSLAGELTTRKNNNLLFVSIIDDSNTRKALLKHYENMLLGILYKYY